MRFRLTSALFILELALVFLLAACGSDTPGSGGGSEGEPTPRAEQSTAGPEDASPEATRRGVLSRTTG